MTNKEPPNASKMVMIMTLLPTAFKVDNLKDVPIEKAMNHNATVETQPICWTNP